MRKIIADFNGVFVSSEFAKTIRWYLAACYFSKKYPEINDNFIESIIKGRKEGFEEIYQKILNNKFHKANIKYSFRFIGDSRGDFAKAMAQKFWKKRISSEELSGIIRLGLKLNNSLMNWFSKPIFENINFFQKFQMKAKYFYKEEGSIGIITMTTTKAFLETIHRGKNFWGDYTQFMQKFLSIDRKGGLKFVECGGDHPEILTKSKVDKKIKVYKSLLKKMNIKANETVAFEDTPAGCIAARKCGLYTIGCTDGKFIEDNHFCSIQIIGGLKKLEKYVDLFIVYCPKDLIAFLKEVI